MPTVNLSRDQLFAALGATFTDDEFDQLCFEFGIELDEVTSEQMMIRKERGGNETAEVEKASDAVVYKIEVPANRSDLLSLEGLAMALQVFLSKRPNPEFRIVPGPHPERNRIVVKSDTKLIRPFIVSAILRGITFTQEAFDSCIEFQDKLHHNICRKRTLVAIGTHDLDTLEGPFTYEALAPEEISFVPLKQERSFRADELMKFYESDIKLRQFLPIIRDSPVYPVIYDSKRTLLSLPPIINGEHSKIARTTRNMLIECTATDLTKATMILNMIVTQFSQYCDIPFSIESVSIHYEDNRLNTDSDPVYPVLDDQVFPVLLRDIHVTTGLEMEAESVCTLLRRMMLPATLDPEDSGRLLVRVPPNRCDVLHACDVIEDVAIAYGYNNLPHVLPKTVTIGRQQPLNKLTDLLRTELAMAGFTEVLTLILCSVDENFKNLRRIDDGTTAVKVANPKTIEFQQCRTSLLVGLLKTISANKKQALPLQLFEIADVVLKTDETDVGSKNVRRVAAIYCNKVSGFETIHGLLDRAMDMLNVPRNAETGYSIRESNEPTFFAGRQAEILYRGQKIGNFGIFHPEVLEAFELSYPCTAMEFDLAPFL